MGDFLPLAFAPLTVLPSIAITCPLLKSAIELTHSIKQASNWSLSIAEKVLLMVSFEGIPLCNYSHRYIGIVFGHQQLKKA